MTAPFKFEILQKMFKNNDLRLKKNNSLVTRESVMAEVADQARDSQLTELDKAEEYKPPSRMQIDRKKVKYEMLKQIEHNKFKKKKEKLIDLVIGEHMIQNAESVLIEQEKFIEDKKFKAKKVMRENWDEQLRTRNNEEIVDRIF